MALQQSVRQNNKFTSETTVFVALAALVRCKDSDKLYTRSFLLLLWTHLPVLPKRKAEAKPTVITAVTGFGSSKATFISVRTFNRNNDRCVSWQISPLLPHIYKLFPKQSILVQPAELYITFPIKVLAFPQTRDALETTTTTKETREGTAEPGTLLLFPQVWGPECR